MKARKTQLSPVRVFVVAAVVAVATAGIWSQMTSAYALLQTRSDATWFAPYVDTTLTPTFDFQDAQSSPSRYVVLAFIVADPLHACSPSWGGYFSLLGAEQELDLDRRIARLRLRGGDAVISFGGAAGSELADACTNTQKLMQAYGAVISRYHANTIDLDIEGAGLSNRAANIRRGHSIARLQAKARAAHTPLRVWLTLPVAVSGLTADDLAAVREMVKAGVRLAGVNVMTMDYGQPFGSGKGLITQVKGSLDAAHRQLAATRLLGRSLPTSKVWEHMGATVMIGRNDSPGEVFSLSDAKSLVGFARSVQLGRVSMWSANRDYKCGGSNARPVSNLCSGVDQKPLAYTWELTQLSGRLPAQTKPSGALVDRAPPTRDSPATSPYAIWLPLQVYMGGDMVVWHDEVYEAKWWNQSVMPDAPAAHPWDTPWQDVGPVLPGDGPAGDAPSTTYARPWMSTQVYVEGDRVTYAGFVYEARWWTQGQAPIENPARPQYVPWQLLRRLKGVQR